MSANAAPGAGVAHEFVHGPDASRAGQRRALAWALGINAALVVVGVIGGIAFDSLALLADAAHLLSDVAALGLAVNAGSAVLIHRAQGESLNMRASVAHLATDAAGSMAVLLAGVVIGPGPGHGPTRLPRWGPPPWSCGRDGACSASPRTS